MLESIFRNITDIRIFDLFNCEFNGRDDVDIDEIIEVMEAPYFMRHEVEESVNHLVKQQILQKQNRIYINECNNKEIQLPIYGIAINEVTNHLFKAVFKHIQLYIDE